jgi:hypothetical protein
MDSNNKKLVCTTSKQLQIYEILNKIQNVINTESLLPQFIYFAKNMDEMRKKWLAAEVKCKELEKKLVLEKSICERKINELKIDVEVHNEKRLQAESKCERLQSELDKLQKQFDMFKEVLNGGGYSAYGPTTSNNDRRNYDDRLYSIYNEINQKNGQGGNDQMKNYQQQQPSQNQQPAHHSTRRLTNNRGIEDTGSFNISGFTEDDLLDTQNDENMLDSYRVPPSHPPPPIPQQSNEGTRTALSNASNILNNNILASGAAAQPSSMSLQNETSSGQRKRNQRLSTSLTRNGERREKKRSRTRSVDKQQQQQQQDTGKAITAITTLKIGEDGRPITVTSQIHHNDSEGNFKQVNATATNNNAGTNKMEIQFMPQRNVKNRKKRPSREFLQRSADESESTEDSDIFWNGSDALLDEVSNSNHHNIVNANNIHIMTPIIEAPTPQSELKLYSNVKKSCSAATPCKPGQSSAKQAPIPLARKYKRAHLFKSQVILTNEPCGHCDKRAKFGKMIMKCKECDLVVHNECKDLLQRPCFGTVNFQSQGTIGDYVNYEETPPYVPAILQSIINEIETRGLLTHEVGLYRVNGSDSQIKHLKERLIKRHPSPDFRKIADIHVLCSFVKDFLNNFLTEHLITYDSWYRFAKACEIQNESDRLLNLQQCIVDLPQANRDTLAYIVLHLQRISETPECKMPASNLARVFGPSLVGNSSPNLPAPEIINEVFIQQKVVENLIKLPTSFYLAFIEGADQQQRLFKNSMRTPEMMRKSKTAVVLSSILGPAANI